MRAGTARARPFDIEPLLREGLPRALRRAERRGELLRLFLKAADGALVARVGVEVLGLEEPDRLALRAPVERVETEDPLRRLPLRAGRMQRPQVRDEVEADPVALRQPGRLRLGARPELLDPLARLLAQCVELPHVRAAVVARAATRGCGEDE